jgi:hypothetical protein
MNFDPHSYISTWYNIVNNPPPFIQQGQSAQVFTWNGRVIRICRYRCVTKRNNDIMYIFFNNTNQHAYQDVTNWSWVFPPTNHDTIKKT